MKRIVLFFSIALFSLGTSAQLKTPQPSPFAKIEQVVGLTDITIAYSRPGMRGRTVYGDLVPYDQLWRTGANKNTEITFSDDVKIEGKDVKAGTYAIFTKPGKEKWEIIFYSKADNWGTPENWEDAKVAASVSVKANKIPMNVETFTIMFSDVLFDSSVVNLIWSNTEVSFNVTVPTKEKTIAGIEKVMAGPGASDYYKAATFYKEVGDITKAKINIDKAISLSKEPAFWYYRQQSLIYQKAGDKEGAIKAAQTSLELAAKAGNANYVKLNQDSLAEWGTGTTE